MAIIASVAVVSGGGGEWGACVGAYCVSSELLLLLLFSLFGFIEQVGAGCAM